MNAREQRALLVELAEARRDLTAAQERYKRLRLRAFDEELHIEVIAKATGESYDAVRMARSRARV